MELIAASLARLQADRVLAAAKIYTDKKIGTRIIAVNTRALPAAPG